MMPAPLPCEVLSCFLRLHSITMCKAERCCYLHIRERQEREERERMRYEA